ncbi:hypothetical protein APHAL10511_007344 [Amanita phalloides]|nr:hypothetical protein APHAL10511_007344 [Amanita phalloides]
MPSVAHLSALPASFPLPSNPVILASLFLALLALALVHCIYILFRDYLLRAKLYAGQKKPALVAQEQGVSSAPAKPRPQSEKIPLTASVLEQQSRGMAQGKWSSILFTWFKWESSLPISFSAPRNSVLQGRPTSPATSQLHIPTPPRTEASQNSSQDQDQDQATQLHRGPSWHQARRAGPAFETPLPAMYQTEVPASMAKIIMSRHTYRRPTPRPPSRSSSPSPQVQISKRLPSPV